MLKIERPLPFRLIAGKQREPEVCQGGDQAIAKYYLYRLWAVAMIRRQGKVMMELEGLLLQKNRKTDGDYQEWEGL